MTSLLWPIAAGAALVLVHLFAGRIQLGPEPPRNVWLSAAGGLAVAYVFVHLLPELHAAQRTIEGGGVWMEHHVYLVSLAGLTAFYGIERLARTSRASRRDAAGQDCTSPAVFRLHIGSFALYNFLIGYLLVHREDDSPAGLAAYSVAMALHFFVTDNGLREHHKDAYRRAGRYVVSAAIAAGLITGLITKLPHLATATLFAFLAGGVILNVLKEELPEERQSRFSAFAAGAAAYAAILLIAAE